MERGLDWQTEVVINIRSNYDIGNGEKMSLGITVLFKIP